MKLFKTELLLFVKSLTFIAFCVAAFAFYFTQYQGNVNRQVAHFQENTVYNPDNYLMRPRPGSNDYGNTAQTDKRSVMKNALLDLQQEYQNNTFQTRPVMFVKNVHLKQTDKKKVDQIFKHLTDQSLTTFTPAKANWSQLDRQVSYSRFKQAMGKIDHIIGGQSAYVPNQLFEFGSGKPLSYTAAKHAYQRKMRIDRVSRNFARLFSDYLGIIMLIFSVFPLILYYTKAQRENCQELLDLKLKPTWQYLGVKYLTTVLVLYGFTLLLSIFPAIQLLKVGRVLQLSTDGWAFVKATTLFVLPTIMFISALALVLTRLFKPVITMAIMVVFGIFILSVTDIAGVTTWSPLMRFNGDSNWSTFASLKQAIYLNRLFYIGLTLILFLVAVWLKSRQRRGAYGQH